MKIFIETKHPVRYGALVESKVLALLHRYGIASPASADLSRAVVMSFSAAAVWRIRRAAPMLPTVLLGETSRYLGGSAATTVGATAVGPSIATLREHPELVDRAAAQGRALYCWTVDHYEDVRYCRELGVAWVATNHPGRTKGWLQNGLTGVPQRLDGRDPAARALGAVGIRCRRAHFACDEVLQMEQVGAGPVGDPHQGRHPCDFLDLFVEEPLHELLAEVVALVAGDAGQPADLFGHRALLVERQRQRVARRGEDVLRTASTPGISTSTSRSSRYCTSIIA